MANVNYLLLCQLIVHVFAFILSLCLLVPVAIHLNNFRGHCLLFSSGNWSDKGQLMVEWSSSAYCGYTIFVGAVFLMSSVFQVYRLSIFLYKGIDSSFLSAFIDTITSTLLAVISLVAAVFITLGFKAWCDAITTRYISCKEASSSDMDEKANIVIPGFYIQIGTAQFAAWSAWVCSVALAVFSFLKICQYHQRANIVASMAKERQRLVRDPSNKSLSLPIAKDKIEALCTVKAGGETKSPSSMACLLTVVYLFTRSVLYHFGINPEDTGIRFQPMIDFAYSGDK